MVNVVIEVWPGGDEARKRIIGQVQIANDCTGDVGTDNQGRGNYNVTLVHSGKFAARPGIWRRGRVVGHQRSLSPYHLVAKAIIAALGGLC
jgi:hypothetical protein